MPSNLARALQRSLARQANVFENTLILNPVENIPFPETIQPASSFLHGLYNTDKIRTKTAKRQTAIQFAGRDRIAYDTRRIYAHWSTALGAADLSMRLLSGLHAHIVIFMGLGKIGDRILLLPPSAGGHVATKGILERLGYEVLDIAVDYDRRRVDIQATERLCQDYPPDFIFVDRSEGLIYEDFSRIARLAKVCSVFDASQYLSNILAGDYMNPFDMGFDLIISTLHKNFPGPQKALVCAKEKSDTWFKLVSRISGFVSNMHSFSTYAAGLTLARKGWLENYSKSMLETAVQLEHALTEHGVPAISRHPGQPTHHIWISTKSRYEAFEQYHNLERCRILTNFRLLPYDLGYGLRLGTAAAVRSGLNSQDANELAGLTAKILKTGVTPRTKAEVRTFVDRIKDRNPHQI